jgi:hypothetical protein
MQEDERIIEIQGIHRPLRKVFSKIFVNVKIRNITLYVERQGVP